jgi:hypothetical protein
MTDVRILHRDADLLVLFKPSGLPTTSPDGRGCLTEIAAQLDPSAPRLHASSRLDAEVTGLVTFARTTRAIEGLLAARKAGQYERYYLGLATGPLSPAAGELNWPIDRDPRDLRKRITLDRLPTPPPLPSARRAANGGIATTQPADRSHPPIARTRGPRGRSTARRQTLRRPSKNHATKRPSSTSRPSHAPLRASKTPRIRRQD